MDRKSFLKSVVGITGGAFIPGKDSIDFNLISSWLREVEQPVSGSMYDFNVSPIPKVRVAIVGMGNRGKVLLQMLEWLVKKDHCEIVALCDLEEDNATYKNDEVELWQSYRPRSYHGSPEDWMRLLDIEELDLAIICTPWELHTPMAVYAMENDIHVACEVPIAYTLRDCWQLIKTAESTRRHCIMLENCCYNEEELFVLNMIQEGVFGEVTHAEGAYLHDLRAHMLSDTYYQGQWRLHHHVNRDGNLYTTHGLGPIALYLGLGYGDTISHLTSMSSREYNLSHTAKRLGSSITDYKCGDINNTMIKTEKGKTILLQFDVHTGRPYSRINKVVGTKAVHDGYPGRLYIDDEELQFWGHDWMNDEDYQSMKSKYVHPLIQKLKSVSSNFKQGHGGMDFVMMYRLIRALNRGHALDLNVYDGVAWSAVTPLSELSVASKSMSVPMPDFTAGQWSKARPLQIMKT